MSIMRTSHAYLPQDRLRSLVAGQPLAESDTGSVLFADISGFTALADALARQHGPRRGADVLTSQINQVYSALIDEVARFGGSVIGFAGDAITCWFSAYEAGLQRLQADSAMLASVRNAVACALAMQQAMKPIAQVQIGATINVQLSIKTAVASGQVRRFVVGDPSIQLIDVLAGSTLDRMAAAEHLARAGELLIDEATASTLGEQVQISEWRSDPQQTERFAWVATLTTMPETPCTEPNAASNRADTETNAQIDLLSWVLPALRQRLQEQSGRFLAELRPATSLFLRFDGLDFDNDPNAGDKLDQFIRHVQHIIHRHEAALIQLTTGDKGSYLYAAFGAPIAHDDDARRAIVAALELRNSQSQFPFLISIQIGISQGAMRVGPYGSDKRQTYGVLGEEVNMAARFMTHAKAGEILVSAVVYEATVDDFLFDEPRKIQTKGRSALQTVYAVQGRQVRLSNHLQRLYQEPLAAREGELAQMQQSLAQVMSGTGRILRIEGSAGVGKSHLVATFLKSVEALGIFYAAASCQSTERDSAYHAVRQLARSLFYIGDSLSDAAIIERIEESVRNTNPGLLLRLPLLGEMIGITIPDNATTASLDPKLRQEASLSLAVDLLLSGARRSPRVLLVEDVHWLDEASQSLLLALARVIETAPILLLVVHRPGGDRQGDGYRQGDRETGRQGEEGFWEELQRLGNQDLIRLEELPPSGTIQLVSQRLQGTVSPLAVALIQAQAQGNPFFTEELVDALRESDRLLQVDDVWTLSEGTISALQAANCLLGDGENWQLRADASLSSVDLGVPNSIQGVILSRLDRLPESVKPTSKVASVIGRLFEFDLLVRAHPLHSASAQINEDMTTLIERDFARIERPEPALAYIFKHNITQEVTYNTLLERQRREIHQAVALALEEAQPEAIDRLAFHFYNGDLSQPDVRKKALHYLDRAATRAQRDYANETALSYLNRALQLEQRREWLKAKVEILSVLARSKDLEKALEQLTDFVGEYDFETLLLWGKYYESISEYEHARQVVLNALESTKQNSDESAAARSLNQLGMIAWRQGEYEDASRHYKLALGKCQNQSRTENDAHYGLGLSFGQQGKFREAGIEFEKCILLARQLDDQYTEAKTLNAVGILASLQRDFLRAIDYFEQALAIREQIGDRVGIGSCTMNIAQALSALGTHDKAEPLLRKAIFIHKATGNRELEAHAWNALGVLYLVVGTLKLAKECLQEGIRLSEGSDQSYVYAYLLCNYGQVLRENNEIANAIQVLTSALTIAQSQGDTQLQAICLNDLALTNMKLGNLEQTVEQASKSIALFEQLDVEMSTASNLALLAIAYSQLDKQDLAEQYAGRAITVLDKYRNDGLDFPQRDYWRCYQVFKRYGLADRATAALRAAKEILLKQSAQIGNVALRESYLSSIVPHRQILKESERS